MYQIFPQLTSDEYRELKEDISTRGVQVPVELDDKGNILDGHHRVKICQELGITDYPTVTRYGLSEKGKLLHIRKLNIARRHLSQEQKRNLIEEQLKETPKMSDRQIAKGLGVDNSTVSRTRKKMEESGDVLQCNTSTDTLGRKQPRHRSVYSTKDNQKKLDLIAKEKPELLEAVNKGEESVNSAYRKVKKKEERKEKYVKGMPSSLKIYSVWNFADCDDNYGKKYPGRIPGQVVENVLYYYTKPGDLVIDPMCGGGTTIDVCERMDRKCLGYDVAPVRNEIKQNNIENGFPEEAHGCDLIFMDPPYWNMKDNEYAEGSVSSLSLEDFREFVKKLAKNCYRTLNDGGYATYLIANQTEKSLPDDMRCINHIFDGYNAFLSAGFKFEMQINVPMTTQTFLPQQVEKAKKARRMLGLTRDLLVWKKQKKTNET